VDALILLLAKVFARSDSLRIRLGFQSNF